MSRIRFLILPQCRRTLTAVNFRPVRTSVVAVCCVVILAVPSGRAQEEQNPKNSVLQRTSPAIILRFRPGAWGVAGVELVNHRDQPTEVVTGLYFDEAPMTQFSRRAWLPGNSRRLTWIPALPPDDGRKELRARHFLYSNADDSRTLVRAANELLFEAETLALREPPITVIVDDWYVDDEASLAESKELAITMRLAARYTRVVIEVDADSVPAFHEGLNAVDHIVLAGDQIADSPTGLASIRTWLQNGGRLWVLLDQVKMSTVELLLGDAVEITEVDRVRLT
ncbi:MAG: hypothetical protein ABGZ24_16180, partial [Fuerstiella sp.]